MVCASACDVHSVSAQNTIPRKHPVIPAVLKKHKTNVMMATSWSLFKFTCLRECGFHINSFTIYMYVNSQNFASH